MAYFKDLLNQEFERFSKQFRRFCNSISLFCCFLNILQELRYFFIPPMPDSNFDRSWKLTFQCFRQHKTCLVCILKNLGCLLPHCVYLKPVYCQHKLPMNCSSLPKHWSERRCAGGVLQQGNAVTSVFVVIFSLFLSLFLSSSLLFYQKGLS